MEMKCYKRLDGRGRLTLPAAVREAAGIGGNDVLQITERGGVILLNKAEVSADDPVGLLQEKLRQETETAAAEREALKKRLKQLLDERESTDDIMDEIMDEIFSFMF